MNQSTPPGWYPDGQGGQRWWDGNQWTEHTLPAEASDRPSAPAQPDQPAQPGPSDVTQVRPGGPAGQEPGGDRPSAPEQGPPAAMPTQVAGGGPAQPGYPGGPQQGGYPGVPQQGYGQQQPGYPGQPAWQGQQGGGSGGGISGKMIGIIGGAAAAVIALIVVLVLVLGGGGGSPSDVVEDFLDADSCSDAEDLVSKDFLDSQGECSEEDLAQFDGGDDGNIETDVKDEKIDGDKATVEVEISGSFGGEDVSQTLPFSLVKEDGDWKIDGIG